jgi:hypothetical protein
MFGSRAQKNAVHDKSWKWIISTSLAMLMIIINVH